MMSSTKSEVGNDAGVGPSHGHRRATCTKNW